MALNIDGTTGISGVDGSASAPAVTGTDSNTGINFASDTVNINTAGTTRATVDSAGRLLLGTTTEGHTSGDDLTIATSGTTGITLRSGTSEGGRIFFSDGTSGDDEYRGVVGYNHDTNHMYFSTDATERMRIDNGGRLLLNTTSLIASDCQASLYMTDTVGIAFKPDGTSTRYPLLFQNSSGSHVGSVGTSTTATSYNTSSDYRLKENVTAISDGITRLKTLKPSRFNFKIDTDTTVDGFLAHEVTAVPEAITGTKDEVDSDNNPIYQGIDQSKLVPLLTAALQEAVAKIEVLETKVAALEAG